MLDHHEIRDEMDDGKRNKGNRNAKYEQQETTSVPLPSCDSLHCSVPSSSCKAFGSGMRSCRAIVWLTLSLESPDDLVPVARTCCNGANHSEERCVVARRIAVFEGIREVPGDIDPRSPDRGQF